MGRDRNSEPSPFDIELRSAPVSSPSELIFPWNGCMNSYDVSAFTAHHTDSRITDVDVNNMINQLKRSPFYHRSIFDKQTLMISGGLFALFIVIIIVGGSVGGSGGSVVMIIAVIALAGAIGYAIYRQSQMPKDMVRRREPELRKIVEQIQIQLFDAKDARIILSPYGSYLKLEFKWKTRNVNQQPQAAQGPQVVYQPVYVPVAVQGPQQRPIMPNQQQYGNVGPMNAYQVQSQGGYQHQQGYNPYLQNQQSISPQHPQNQMNYNNMQQIQMGQPQQYNHQNSMGMMPQHPNQYPQSPTRQ